MAEWITINPFEELDPSKTPEDSSDRVVYLPSPYDFPLAVRSYFDKDRLKIEFMYAGFEKFVDVPEGDVTLQVAQNSNRLYGCEVSIDPTKLATKEDRRALMTRLTQAIEKAAQQIATQGYVFAKAPKSTYIWSRKAVSPSANRLAESYRIAVDALRDERDRILPHSP